MSDSDKNLKIGIEVDASKGVAPIKQTTAAVQELNQATTDGGKASVEAGKKIVESTDKAFTSKKQLKDMVKQLGHEFPILGSLGRLALNPIAAATAGVTAAFVIWRSRVREATAALVDFRLPDNSPLNPDRVNAAVAAWEKYRQKMQSIGDEMSGIEARTKSIFDEIERRSNLVKALGGDNPLAAKVAADQKAAAKRAEAEGLRKRGRGKLADAAAIRVGGTEDEGDLEAQIAAARATIAEAAEWSKRIEEAQAGGFGDRVLLAKDFAFRYGYGTTGSDALGMERDRATRAQGLISNNTRLIKDRASRRSRRDELLASAPDDFKAAAMADQEAGNIQRTSGAAFALAQGPGGFTVTPGGTNFGITQQAYQDVVVAQQEMIRLARLLSNGTAALRAEVEKGMQKNLPGKTAPAL